jgi:hypothetical protein
MKKNKLSLSFPLLYSKKKMNKCKKRKLTTHKKERETKSKLNICTRILEEQKIYIYGDNGDNDNKENWYYDIFNFYSCGSNPRQIIAQNFTIENDKEIDRIISSSNTTNNKSKFTLDKFYIGILYFKFRTNNSNNNLRKLDKNEIILCSTNPKIFTTFYGLPDSIIYDNSQKYFDMITSHSSTTIVDFSIDYLRTINVTLHNFPDVLLNLMRQYFQCYYLLTFENFCYGIANVWNRKMDEEEFERIEDIYGYDNLPQTKFIGQTISSQYFYGLGFNGNEITFEICE